MSDEPITLQCHKTGREYEATTESIDGRMVVDTSCPYCESRGLEAIMDGLEQRREHVSQRVE